MSKYCMNCGKEHPDEAKFCINCGSSFTPQPVQHTTQIETNRGIPGKGFGITSLILAIIGFVFCFILFIITLRAMASDSYATLSSGFICVIYSATGAIPSLIFALLAISRGYKKQAVAGLAMSSISIVIIAVYLITLAI